MAREQSSFNYDDLDSATQDFLRQKEKDIKLLISEVGLKPALTGRYRIGEKVVEVRSDLEKNKVKDWVAWIEMIESNKNLDERYIPDFTGVRFRDNQRDIIEIKQPFITLFRKDGEFSHEFNKAWNQVEEYLNFARRNPDYLQRKGLSFDNPECYLIIGYQLSETQLDKIKIKESNNLAIKVLTYDNLISVAEGIINSSKK